MPCNHLDHRQHIKQPVLPIGVMFTAKFGDEATLFRLAAQLELAKPWFDKMPVA